MEKEIKKNAVSNEAYKERFQFLLWINDNIICQRYFKIMGFNPDSVGSEELLETLEECVEMIKDDLNYKSSLYQSIVNDKPVKLTGFSNNMENLNDLYLLINDEISGSVYLSDGTTVDKTYFNYSDDINEVYDDEDTKPWDVVFKFEFLIDDRNVFERIWDGSIYPKFVRNSVDLSNSITGYTKTGNVNFTSNEGISNYLKLDRVDLVYYMIRKIVDAMSGNFDNPDAYTHTINFEKCALEFDNEKYEEVRVFDLRSGNSQSEKKAQAHPVKTVGPKEYYYANNNRKLVDSYYKWTRDKTRKYNAWLNRCERYADSGGLTPGEWDHFEKYC